MLKKTSFTYELNDRQQRTLIQILRQGNYRPVVVQHTLIAVEAEECRVSLYRSGKCLVQGSGAEDFVTFILEPNVLQAAQLGYEDLLNPEATRPHMGIDESGKGDFFGPLVVAGAFVDESLIGTFRELDVKDSKKITSDNKALDLGRNLRKLLGRRYSLVRIGPQAYNRLYARIRNVNSILAWAHARAIENLLEVQPHCPMAISDQFGSKQQVERALMKKGKNIELIQRHRAESDLAVAAASIIAREIFLRSLKEMELKYKVKFPKGASDAVKESATALVRNHRPDILLETAKCHFKTTDAVLAGLHLNRSALGPDGQITSKPLSHPFGKRKQPQ